MRIAVEEAQPVKKLTPTEFNAMFPGPTISRPEYAEAVAHLAVLAQSDTSGSLAAAQVLLSAYNSYEFQLAITDLCNLDIDNFEAAMQVIRGRKELSTEPHTLITDGTAIFERLANNWKRYNIDNRHRKTCYYCGGSGELSSIEDGATKENCNRCNASGYEL